MFRKCGYFLLFLCISTNAYIVLYNDDSDEIAGSACFGFSFTNPGDTIIVDVTNMEGETLPTLNLTVSNENCDSVYQVIYQTSTAIGNHYVISYISTGSIQFFSVTPSGSQQNYQITVTSGFASISWSSNKTGPAAPIYSNDSYVGYLSYNQTATYYFMTTSVSFDLVFTGYGSVNMGFGFMPSDSNNTFALGFQSNDAQLYTFGPCEQRYKLNTTGMWYLSVSLSQLQNFTLRVIYPSSKYVPLVVPYDEETLVTLKNDFTDFQLHTRPNAWYIFYLPTEYQMTIFEPETCPSASSTWISMTINSSFAYFPNVSSTINLRVLSNLSSDIPVTIFEKWSFHLPLSDDFKTMQVTIGIQGQQVLYFSHIATPDATSYFTFGSETWYIEKERFIPSSPQLYGTFGSQVEVHHCDGYQTDYLAIDTVENVHVGYLTLKVVSVKEGCWPLTITELVLLLAGGVLVVAGAIALSMWCLRQRKSDYSHVPNEVSLTNI